mmetsp:Transcript_17673/g.30583  ORF Transcript_17673/g.30583 Transcript_17673/m.30583 type:complete len:200 (-) Transcript_17673:623-1222(-)
MCSHFNEQAPNVSASSSPFSCPQRSAKKSMKYMATARCRICSSRASQSLRYCERIRSMFSPSSRAFSNFLWSDFPFTALAAANITYFRDPIESIQWASHVTFLSWRTSFHLRPVGGSGTLASSPMLMLTSSGAIRFFNFPIIGCFPRPRKRPGGSTRKLPTGCFLPSHMQNLYSFSSSSFSFFICSFCSRVNAFFSSFC